MKSLLPFFVGLFGFLTQAEIAASPVQAPVQQVLIYQKTNADGSNLGHIAVYYPTANQIESLKWHQGHGQATLVTAKLDKQQLVRRFDAYRLSRQQAPEKMATLEKTTDGHFTVQLGDQVSQATLPEQAWHSYDFDFASLGVAYRFIDKQQFPYSFHIYDLNMATDTPEFIDMGAVTLSAPSPVEKWGYNAVQYQIDGPGLDNRGGTIWFDAEQKHLLGFAIAKPDESSYDSGNLQLVEVRQMTSEEWAAFKINALGE
ncbi:hypothetical protein [Bowmanella dokdonensis]|uniref:Uncharacterized protein n=1 Tax=Bowmanella dokdonensis TaxID=751969 RepID=A0A939DM59_9ALTE|nr:hypothetical protein [Bowmanella dokdonensis]MBN7825140.1 hypothetical protein [Bowmanella dokdonensis]